MIVKAKDFAKKLEIDPDRLETALRLQNQVEYHDGFGGITFDSSLEDAVKKVWEEYCLPSYRSEQAELDRRNYAHSIVGYYEYDVVTIVNKGHGLVDKNKIKSVLTEYSKAGWKLHTMYSNELGKNALMILGLGINSTACEDVMIFERHLSE